jgi:hypothetical protein
MHLPSYNHSRAILRATMNMKLLLAIILMSGTSLAFAGDKAPPELKPDTFRFLRAEKETFPPIKQGDHVVAPSSTVINGVFAFRYSHWKPLKFWGFGEPEARKFTTRFTEYRIRKKSDWERCPVGYCGTGATTYALQPGVDYELRIALSVTNLSEAAQIRVSADSPDATFWSEPFTYPKR